MIPAQKIVIHAPIPRIARNVPQDSTYLKQIPHQYVFRIVQQIYQAQGIGLTPKLCHANNVLKTAFNAMIKVTAYNAMNSQL